VHRLSRSRNGEPRLLTNARRDAWPTERNAAEREDVNLGAGGFESMHLGLDEVPGRITRALRIARGHDGDALAIHPQELFTTFFRHKWESR